MLMHRILESFRSLARAAVHDERDPSKDEPWAAFEKAAKRFIVPSLTTDAKQLVKDLRAYGDAFPDGPGMFKDAADLICDLSCDKITQDEANNLIADFRDAVTDDALCSASDSHKQVDRAWNALVLAITKKPSFMYSWQPDGHGPRSFFVVAASPEEAAHAVNAYRRVELAKGTWPDYYTYGRDDLKPSDFHVSAPGEVIENNND